MDAFERFKKRMLNTSGISARDEQIKNSKQNLQNMFFDDASANPNIILWNTDKKLDCRITDRKFNTTYGIKAKIQVLLNSILKVGDIIYNATDKEYWMCTNLLNINDIYKQGEITLCNYTLKFQSPTGTILSYPCIDDSSFMDGLDEGKTITTLNGVHRIKLPFDDNTKLIGVGRRFFLDKSGTTTYEVTNVNNTTYNYGDKGLIELTLKQDSAYNPLTDKNGVCNYFEPTTDPKPPVEGYSYAVITCSNPNNEITLGSSTYRMLVPTFYNADATLASGITAVWNWELPNGYESYFDIKYDGNLAKIKVLENYDLLGTTVKGNVMSSNGGYGGSITLTIIV